MNCILKELYCVFDRGQCHLFLNTYTLFGQVTGSLYHIVSGMFF